MGPGSWVHGGGVGWINLHVAVLDESLKEAEALAQGGYCDVSAIFATLLRECSDQVVGDECQLGMRILFRHARVRQIVRATRNLPLAQRQAGWSRLEIAYLTLGDDQARQLMRQLND